MAVPFDVSLGEGDLVYMQLVGSLDAVNLEILKMQIDAAKRLVKAESEKRDRKLRVLFDLTHFTGTYNVESMIAMKGLEEYNRPYLTKTAVFGGSAAAQIAAELTLEIIGRDNIKLFHSKEEAQDWLIHD
jgi:hypothetical protein